MQTPLQSPFRSVCRYFADSNKRKETETGTTEGKIREKTIGGPHVRTSVFFEPESKTLSSVLQTVCVQISKWLRSVIIIMKHYDKETQVHTGYQPHYHFLLLFSSTHQRNLV
jgi:hypothetical protein